MSFSTLLLFITLLFYIFPVSADSPSLPPGLGGIPSLPSGLGSGEDKPGLPPGLGSSIIAGGPDNDQDDDISEPWAEYSGFWEYRYADRMRDTDLHKQVVLNESRLHLAMDKLADTWAFEAGIDFLYDDVAIDHDIDLESGAGWIDLRKFSLLLKLSPMLDLQVGRQVLTWGTGDLLFLNDLFPKDWHYWLGRDIEYIKAPSDAVKLSWFNPAVNFDLVYTPRFDSDRYITGERLSFWNDSLGRHSGRDDIILVDKPDDLFSDDEWSFRLYRNIGSMELALYGYDGYFKSPAGIDTTTGKFTFPAMRSLGASLRTPAGPGILNLETANWRSKDDTSGTDPFINNSETRFLMGYEWEAMKNFTVAVQYYVSKMDEYNNYIDNLPAGILKRPELHEVYTLRLTKFMINQNLKLTWFSYYSPENNDVYIRPEANYQINDQWTVEVGAEWMDVDDDEPNGFFGQFKNNSNVFVAVRYNFAGDI